MKLLSLSGGAILAAVAVAGCGSGSGGTTGTVPTHLVITQQPELGEVDAPLTPLIVELRDAENQVVIGSSATISVHLREPGLHLTGVASHRADRGVVTFDGLAIDTLGDFTMVARSGTLDSVVANPVQIGAPGGPSSTAEVAVGGPAGAIKFRSTQNQSSNPAVDSIAVDGSVTWSWFGGLHGVQSVGAKPFTSSDTSSVAGHEYTFTFTSTGDYDYQCSVHLAAMSGRVVVR